MANKSETDLEKDDDARRFNFCNEAFMTRTSRNYAGGNLNHRQERDSEIRNLWLGDTDPMDIEENSVEHRVEGFSFIDPKRESIQ